MSINQDFTGGEDPGPEESGQRLPTDETDWEVLESLSHANQDQARQMITKSPSRSSGEIAPVHVLPQASQHTREIGDFQYCTCSEVTTSVSFLDPEDDASVVSSLTDRSVNQARVTESLLGLYPSGAECDRLNQPQGIPDHALELEKDDAQPESQHICRTENIDILIHRASIKSQGLPDPGDRPKLPYESSLVSNYTDLGVHGLRNVDKSGSGRANQASSNAIHFDENEPIADRLLIILEKTPGHHGTGFFPQAVLNAIITEQCVKAELKAKLVGASAVPARTIDEYTKKICGTMPFHDTDRPQSSLKKIFAALVLSRKVEAIPLFIDHNLNDDDLPFQKIPTERPKIFSLGRRSNGSGPPAESLECFQMWQPLEVRDFEEWQWATLAPFFHSPRHKDVAHFILANQIPLPFTADSRYSDEPQDSLQRCYEFEGGYSNVFKVNIHPDHHAFHNHPRSPDRGCAIKCLFSRDREEFQQEAGTLMKFSGEGHGHPHLISLLATYEQFNRFYLVFPWADADLHGYWSKIMPNPTFQYETILWIAKQCRGIAQGLLKIHKYESSMSRQHGQLYGRHGDIKPENILWFRNENDKNDMGTLKITDFGLTEFSKHSKTYRPRTKLAVSPSYRPPECDLEGAPIGRSYDIWTLGCLYLEMIAWILGGWELVQEFRIKRLAIDPMWFDMESDTFFEIVQVDAPNPIAAMIKPAVTEFILDLHAHPKCSEYLHKFLQIIQMDMLVVKRPDRPDHGRLSCSEVYTSLHSLYNQCEQKDSGFATEPCPWTKRPNDVRHHSDAFEVVVSKTAARRLKLKLSTLRKHEGRHTWLSDSPAALACREILSGSHECIILKPESPTAVAQHQGSRIMKRNLVSSYTTSF